MKEIKFNEKALFIVNELIHNGYDSYIVGGCVRDSLMGKVPHDWDVCTSALPEQVKEIFSGYRIIDTGLKHGTVTILIDDESFEVTTFRVESGYSDKRHPDKVEFVKSIYEDLARRDFTINAIAYNPVVGYVDPYGGRLDIQSGLIKCVNNPVDRFIEDPLRILRAIRFYCQLGFRIDNSTSYGMRAVREGIRDISYERISSELKKMIVYPGFDGILLAYADIITEVIPEFRDCIGFQQKNSYHIYDVYEHIVKALKYCCSSDYITRFAILFHDIGKPHSYQDGDDGYRHFLGHPTVSASMTETILRRMRFDNESISKIVELVSYHDATLVPSKKHIRRWLNKIGEEQFRRLIDIKIADLDAHKIVSSSTERRDNFLKVRDILNEILKEESCFSIKDLAINGRDLIVIGVNPGPKMGEILNTLLDKVMGDELENTRDSLLNFAKSML